MHGCLQGAPNSGNPCTVILGWLQIRGVARDNAEAKDSEWVRQRAAMQVSLPVRLCAPLSLLTSASLTQISTCLPLQDAKPPDVNEILLLDRQGGVLEGMSSNVFVVTNGHVVTPDKGILVGTVRNLVLEVGTGNIHLHSGALLVTTRTQ